MIGIRSIGTTLSAVTTAALNATRAPGREDHSPADRASLCARTSVFSQDRNAGLRNNSRDAADFLVVDEGPGRSGSTFLSVVEALMRIEVPQDAHYRYWQPRIRS